MRTCRRRAALVVLLALAAWASLATAAAAHHSPNALYAGTHSGGGTLTFTVSPDAVFITKFAFLDVPCADGSGTLDSEVSFSSGGVPISGHVFNDVVLEQAFSGSFTQDQAASGSFQNRGTSPDQCVTETVSWTANTTAPPPPACLDGLDNDNDGRTDEADVGCSTGIDQDETDPPACSDGRDNDGDGARDLADLGCTSPADGDETDPDTTIPSAQLSASKVQKAGRSVLVRISCPDEACIARATGSVNLPGRRAAQRLKLRPATANVPKGGRATLRLRVPRKVLAAIRRSLARRKPVRAKLTVAIRDVAGNGYTERRTIRLRR